MLSYNVMLMTQPIPFYLSHWFNLNLKLKSFFKTAKLGGLIIIVTANDSQPPRTAHPTQQRGMHGSSVSSQVSPSSQCFPIPALSTRSLRAAEARPLQPPDSCKHLHSLLLLSDWFNKLTLCSRMGHLTGW